MVVGPRKSWIVAKCGHGDTYYFYLEPWYNIRTEVCGPQWGALCEAYDIDEDDFVKFTYVANERLFLVEVTSANNVVKPWVQEPGMLVFVKFLPHLVVYICQTP